LLQAHISKMTRKQVLQLIEKEFVVAEQARKSGNEGMVRVCARRASGAAIAYWLQSNPRSGWGADAMNRLRNMQLDTSIPHAVRDAALRLTTKITDHFTAPFPTSPIEDSKIIVTYFLGIA
jgi:hypothetical protein